MRFKTEEEYVEHVRTKHPDKWKSMKSDYEPELEENDNGSTAGEEDTNEVGKTTRIILTAGFIGAVALILFVSIYDNEPKLLPHRN
jgi:hypothetical protein